MTNFNSMTHSITAAIGAILVSTMFLGAAIGPVHASQLAQVQTSAQVHA